MKLLGLRFGKDKAAPEARSGVVSSSPEFLELLGLSQFGMSSSDVVVNSETALSVPAVWAAVNFISGTIAGLPLNLYQRDGANRKRVPDTPLAMTLHDAVNDEMSSFEWRKQMFSDVLLTGRGLTLIHRGVDNSVDRLERLNPASVSIRKKAGATQYIIGDGRDRVAYAAADIIDIPFMLTRDGLTSRSPVAIMSDVIGLSIAATRFGSKFFQNGGVPPFAITGGFQSGGAMARAGDDLEAATRHAAQNRRMALILPAGVEIKPLGANAEQSQLLELKQFLVEEVARIYSLPPVFLQDLSHGTYSNTEQQDLHFVKHTLKRWVEAFEQELNLKLFGRGQRDLFAELNMDGLLRGDFGSRMNGYAQAIQNAVMTPNEARQMENRPEAPEGANLLIQGATVPLGSQPTRNGETDGA